jgi:hypothetical protein
MKPSCTKVHNLPADLSAVGGQAGKDMNLAIAISRLKGVIKHEGSMVFKIQK